MSSLSVRKISAI